MTVDPPVDDDRFADLLSACDDALAKGTLPEVSGDLPSDQLRPRVERGVAFLVRLHQLRAARAAVVAPRPTVIDRFVVRRELGRGGFGTVYLAFDPWLNRDVAVKVPHAGALAAPDLRARFRAEVQTAAGLDHPNLVPVYEAGEAGEVSYLVSAYCPGGTLADWLRARRAPVPAAAAAALVETLARAVQYAHSHGVVHRDLKPANVLLVSGGVVSGEWPDGSPLTTHHSPLTPKITDFGLAKRFAAAESDTRDGTFVGTPSYMAPEQATKGGVVGPTTDVYALGTILYECLIGRPPFQGDSPLETLEQVRASDPVPPGRLRPKLPRDLETICLKCLEKSQTRRYATAGGLADDLARFLAGRPVSARRVGPTGRAWRYAKRRPAVASLLAALVATVIGGGAGIFWQWQRAEANAVAMRDQRDAAERERNRAEANLRRAGRAVRGMAEAGDKLFSQPGHEDAGRKIIEQAAIFHEGFVADEGDDATVLLEAARGWVRAAMIRQNLGQAKAAIAANDRAVELYDRLLVADPPNRRFRLERALRLRAAALYHAAWDADGSAAGAAYVAARAALQGLCADAPDDPSYRFQLANILMNMGVFHGNHGRTNEAITLFEEAVALQRQNLTVAPNDPGYRVELALSQESLGQILWDRSRSARGDDLCREARETFRRVAGEYPKRVPYQWLVARAASYAGDRADRIGRLADAEREYRQALADLAAIRAQHPRNVMYAAEQLTFVAKLAGVIHAAGRVDEAEALYRQATELAEKLAGESPDELVTGRARPATAHLRFAEFLATAGRPADAVSVLHTAHRLWPAEAAVANALARRLADDPGVAPADAAEAVRLAEDAVRLDAGSADSWTTLGIARVRAADAAGAVTALQKAVAMTGGDGARTRYYLALAHCRRADAGQARTEFARGLEMSAAQPADPQLDRLRAEVQAALSRP